MARSGEGSMIGMTGRVTGRIAPGQVGEVMVRIRGGSEAFYAYASTPDEVIEPGALVIVVDHLPPRALYVDRFG